jgi:molybdate transport system ATP-binding protein
MTLSVALRHGFSGFSVDIAFEAATPGVIALFGPSGAGKSTVLSAVAGLLRADRARVVIDGTVLEDTAARVRMKPERRRVGLVFQDARLFPHMTVAGNLRYGQRRAPSQGIGFDGVVELLGLGALLGRRPIGLSGGERQRVAIGRALLAQPLLLLMDEPLASLDAARRAEILPYLARLKTALRLPVLYVTHALDEVMRLADTLVLIEAGRVRAAGPVASVVGRADLPLAARDDAGALLTGVVAAHDPARRLTQLQCDSQPIWAPLLEHDIGSTLRIRVPAREVVLATAVPQAISLHNVVPCRVRGLVTDAGGGSVLVELGMGQAMLLARVTADAVERLDLHPDAAVLALFKSMALEVF